MAKLNVNFNRTNGKIEITAGGDFNSEYSAILRITNPNNVLVYENTGWDGVDFSSVDVDDSTDFEYSLPTNTDGEFVAGDYHVEAYYDDTGITEAHKIDYFDEAINYCYTPPTADLSLTYDCYSSSLTLKDNTEYKRDCCGDPVSKDFTLTYSYPENIEGGAPIDITETSTNIITVSPIYTDINTGKVETNLTYEISDGDDFYATVEDYLYGYDYIEVQCDDCICEMYSCIKQLMRQWFNSIGVNPTDEARLRTQVIKLNALYNKYRIAVQCGEADEVRSICAEILSVIDLYGCTCCGDEDDDGYATEVVPVGGVVTSGDGAEVLFTSTDPAGSLGDDGDVAIQTADGSTYNKGDIFKKESGSWVFKLNIVGNSGADGVSSGTVIESDYSETVVSDVAVENIKISLPYDGENALSLAGDRILLRFWILASDDLDSGSQVTLGSKTIDNLIFSLESTEASSDDSHLYFELEFSLLEDYSSGADTRMSGKVNFSGKYNDVKNIYYEMVNAGTPGLEDVIVSIRNDGGSGSVTFQGYDMTYFKAI